MCLVDLLWCCLVFLLWCVLCISCWCVPCGVFLCGFLNVDISLHVSLVFPVDVSVVSFCGCILSFSGCDGLVVFTLGFICAILCECVLSQYSWNRLVDIFVMCLVEVFWLMWVLVVFLGRKCFCVIFWMLFVLHFFNLEWINSRIVKQRCKKTSLGVHPSVVSFSPNMCTLLMIACRVSFCCMLRLFCVFLWCVLVV